MQIPTGEQWLRLADLIKESKLSSVGLQEAMDRAREMELSGLYKQMAQTVRSLFANRSHFKLWQMAELAVITRAEQDLESVIEECGKDDDSDFDCFHERMKAYLTLAAGIKGRAALDEARELLIEKGRTRNPWDEFDCWRQLYELSQERRDYDRMIRVSKDLSDKSDKVIAYGILEKFNPDVDHYGSWIKTALDLLDQMPMDSARFRAMAKLALTVHDKRCYEEFVKCQSRIKFEERSVVTSLTSLAVCVNYPEFGAVTEHDYQFAFQNTSDYNEEKTIVNAIVDRLFGIEATNGISHIACFLPACSEIKNAVLARLTRFYMERGLFPEARRHFDRIEPPDQLLGLELLCAEVNAGKSKKKNFETLRQYVEKMEKGYLDGLIMVAETTGQSRDIADAFEAVNNPKDIPHHRINMTLPLIRIAKRELDKLFVK